MKKQYLMMTALIASLVLAAAPAADEAAKAVKAQKLPNLAPNGTFEKLSKNGTAVSWLFWRGSKSKAVVKYEKNAGIDGSTAAVFAGGGGCILSRVKVRPGDQVYARIKAKRNGKGTAAFTLRFQTAKGTWLNFTVNKNVPETGDGEWTLVEIAAAAPADAGFVIPMAGGLNTVDGSIAYDNAEVYIIPAAAK